MWKVVALLALFCTTGCGYKLVEWESKRFQTLTVLPVSGPVPNNEMKIHLKDALIERTLAGSGLRPIDRGGQLALETVLSEYSEQVIATEPDGRTSRLQFTLRASFTLKDQSGTVIWTMANYQYSDQFSISTAQGSYRDETTYVQDDAMRSIADLVVTNMTLAVNEWEHTHE